MAGWGDVGLTLGPTCRPSHGEHRRIDHILASKAALPCIMPPALSWDEGIATHAILQADFRWPNRHKLLARIRAAPVDLGVAKGAWPSSEGRSFQDWEWKARKVLAGEGPGSPLLAEAISCGFNAGGLRPPQQLRR